MVRKTTRLTVVAALVSAALAVLAQRPAAAAPKGFNIHQPGATIVVDHAVWRQFLGVYLVVGDDGINRLRYGAVTPDDRAGLADYIRHLEGIDPTTLSADEAFAYWANLYNALTVGLVIDQYPVASIRQIGGGLFNAGPWKQEITTVNGQRLSLDNIEHDILRAHWREPRVHYAVNCASLGCPNLLADPFTGETLDRQLDAAARAYVNHPRGVRIDDGRIVASSIYKWFKVDFGDSDAGVLDHLAQYAEPDLQQRLRGARRIHRYDYDWSLNDAGDAP